MSDSTDRSTVRSIGSDRTTAHPSPTGSVRTPLSRPPARTPRHPERAARLGWDAGWDAARRAVLDAPSAGRPADTTADAPDAQRVDERLAEPARVTRVDAGACDVLLTDLTPARARWSPRLARAAAGDPTRLPAAGDWVLLEPGTLDGTSWSVETVLPRRTSLVRLGVSGTSHGQVLAANADVVAVVDGMVPDLDVGRVERLLTLAWSSGAEPVVVLTKADLHPDPGAAMSLLTASAAGCALLPVATPRGEGLEPLRERLARGATVAFVGASGVGKSTLVNALLGDDAMATQTLGAEGKGRHTTVTRELRLVPGGGAVLDTPGIRSVGLAGGEDLAETFSDVADLAAHCRFADCEHTSEPGCAVQAAIADGTLPARRLASWRDLQREARYQARRTDARLRTQWRDTLKARQRDYRSRPDKPHPGRR